RSNYDLGIIDGTSPCSTTDIYRSTYAHLALMGQFFKGVFKMGTNNINNTPADLKVFSSYLANGYYAVMILNESSNSYADYTINTSSTLPTSGTLRIALNLSTNQSYTNSTYTLGAWTTHLAILDPCNNGTIIEIFEYDRDNLAKYDKLPIRKINTALPLTLQWSSMTNSNCSSNTGSATISASGGSGTYTYSWSSGITSTTASASNLAPGTYTVYVSNSSGCTAQEQATITIGNITPSASVLPTTSCNSSETFTASSGSSYSWSTGATTSGITVSQPSGPNSYTSYTVTVTDGTSGCANSAVATHFSPLSVTIEDGTTSTGTCCAVSLYATFIPGATYSWYIGGSLYTTTSTNKFDDPFSGPGDYTVKATLAGCNSPTSSIHKVTNNGHSCSCGRENAFSNPVDASSLVALNPNPSTGITSIYYTLVSQVTEARLEIVDIYGQKIKELILDVSDNQVLSDLSNLADGIYFVTLQINNSQNISTKKLVLQH
ncbi:MAG TPA: T9SS type A sorting domain-containing protein, partial [Bacteroidia bacterium]